MQAGAKPNPLICSVEVENSEGIRLMKNELVDLLHLTKKRLRQATDLKYRRKNLPCCFYISANLAMSIQQLSDGGEEICDSFY